MQLVAGLFEKLQDGLPLLKQANDESTITPGTGMSPKLLMLYSCLLGFLLAIWTVLLNFLRNYILRALRCGHDEGLQLHWSGREVQSVILKCNFREILF